MHSYLRLYIKIYALYLQKIYIIFLESMERVVKQKQHFFTDFYKKTNSWKISTFVSIFYKKSETLDEETLLN